jgi:hypothetical protein
VIYAYLQGGEHATPDELLSSNGDGSLQVVAGTESRIAQALEEVNATDSASVDERIRVVVL